MLQWALSKREAEVSSHTYRQKYALSYLNYLHHLNYRSVQVVCEVSREHEENEGNFYWARIMAFQALYQLAGTHQLP